MTKRFNISCSEKEYNDIKKYCFKNNIKVSTYLISIAKANMTKGKDD